MRKVYHKILRIAGNVITVWMAGFGYMRNSLDFDYEKMQTTLQKATNKE